MKKVCWILLITILFGVTLAIFTPSIQADSGWDSSYDSGGSDYSSSSSWSSSSDSSWSSSDGNSESGSYDEKTAAYIVLFFDSIFVTSVYYSDIFQPAAKIVTKKKFLLLARLLALAKLALSIIIFFYNKVILNFEIDGLSIIYAVIDFLIMLGLVKVFESKKKNYNYSHTEETIKSVPREELEKYSLNEEQLRQELYQIFIGVQMAWMEFDYPSLKRLCSDELYNSYKSDLEVLKLKHGKNIMSDFTLMASVITDIRKEQNQLIVSMYLFVSFYDYVIDVDSEQVIRGGKGYRLYNQYDLEFVRNMTNENISCPNCGGRVINQECESCHSKIESGYNQFVLAKKKIHK